MAAVMAGFGEYGMSVYDDLKVELRRKPRRWLVTGVAGFIGSNLLEELLQLDQQVVGLDNFSTGKHENLSEVQGLVTYQQWQRFKGMEGDIRDLGTCLAASEGVDIILHQAALGSVPRSIEDPISSNDSNITGTLTMLKAACDNKVPRMVYASSSAVYGDHPGLPKVEQVCGTPLSPYAVTKVVDELYANLFSQLFGLETIGLRYFNVFGPRQDPEGAYAAVIPRWIATLARGAAIFINGTGETSRDFCFIKNVVQANLLAGTTTDQAAVNQVYNVALNKRTTLNELYAALQKRLPVAAELKPVYQDFRAGDVLHSQADISKAEQLLGYCPAYTLDTGLDAAMGWYLKQND